MAFTVRKIVGTVLVGAGLVLVAACTGGPDGSSQLNPQPLPPTQSSSGDNGSGDDKNSGEANASSSSGGSGTGGAATTDNPAPSAAPDAGSSDASHDGD